MRNSLLVFSLLLVGVPVVVQTQGKHAGEAAKISAEVSFLSPAGTTRTDAQGITYQSGGWSYTEPKIYPQPYWGSFPLYFVGQAMRFQVRLSNTAVKGEKPFRVRVQALNRVLETNGALGMEIGPMKEWIVEDLRPGESSMREFSIDIVPDPNLPSGLDVTKVRILHENQGSADAGLIKEEIAVWCPPALKDSPKR
ncbi:MAG: hypothetical protein WCU88_01245 [Elusimicrobiota bacterium]|jgi:hypothetical protein